jgi:hypothetical protein
MTHMAHAGPGPGPGRVLAGRVLAGRVLAGRVLAGRVLAHTAHGPGAARPAPWCCAAARPCALVLRGQRGPAP